MLKAARAQGMPMMVIAMMAAAISQPSAIQKPPSTIQSEIEQELNGGHGRPSERRLRVISGAAAD